MVAGNRAQSEKETIMEGYRPASIEADSALLAGISSFDLSTNTQTRSESSDGEARARMTNVFAQDPTATFQSTDIVSALGITSQLGVSISAMTAGLKFYLAKMVDEATADPGSVHRMFTIVQGILVPKSLSGSGDGDVTLDGEATATWDGTNDPIQISDTAALPVISAAAARFGLGSATIGSVSIGQVNQLSIDFGIELEVLRDGANIWPEMVIIKSIKPVLSLTGTKISNFAAGGIPLLGKAGTHANTTFWLRKRESGATFLADATAEHVKFTAAGLAYVETVGGSHDQPAELSIKMPLDFDGTNEPLTVNTATAIT